MYKSATQLWEEHVTSFDWVINKEIDSYGIFVDGGCGNERFIERYSDLFKNCIGIDKDIVPRKNNQKNTHFIKGDLESLPLKSESIDVFIINFVL